MKIIIKGDLNEERVEVQVDEMVNCFIHYTPDGEHLVVQLEKLMKRIAPEALIEVHLD